METTWRPVLIAETEKPYWKPLQQFVRDERRKYKIFPPDKEVFAALHLTPYEKVSVLILGQDPYHGEGLLDHRRTALLIEKRDQGLAHPKRCDGSLDIELRVRA